MELLGKDTYRSFAFGFAAGAIALFAALSYQGQAPFSADLVPSAQAAPSLPDNTQNLAEAPR